MRFRPLPSWHRSMPAFACAAGCIIAALSFVFFIGSAVVSAADLLTVAPNTAGTDDLIGAQNANWTFTATTTNAIAAGDVIEFIFPTHVNQITPFSTTSAPTLVATSSKGITGGSFNVYVGPQNKNIVAAGGALPSQMTSNGLAIYGFATTTIDAGATISMAVSGLGNPAGQLSSVQNLPFVVQAGTLNDSTNLGSGFSGGPKYSATSTVTLARAGGALVSDAHSSVADSSNDTGASVTVTVSITLASALPAGSKIGVNLPAEFDLTNATTTAADAAGISTTTGPIVAESAFATTTSAGTNRIVFTTSGGTVPAGNTLTVSIGGLKNPSNAGVFRPFSVFTMKSNNGLLDGSYFGFEQSDYSSGAPSPTDAIYVGGHNRLAIQVLKQTGSGTTTLSAADLSQVSVAAGCPDKQFFMGQRWLDANGVAVYSNILDCNYMLGVDPFNQGSASFYSSFLPPAMKTVNLVASGSTGSTATTTLVFAVPDATTTIALKLPNAVTGAHAFIQSYSADNQSFSPVFTDTTYTTSGFDASGNGYAIIPIHSGTSWSFNVVNGSFGSSANFKDSSGAEYWPPVISPVTVTSATTTNVSLGTYSYVKADQTLLVNLTTTIGGAITDACVGVMRNGGGVFSQPQDMTCSPNYSNSYRFKVPSGAITVVVNRPGFGNQGEFPVAVASSTPAATTTSSFVLSSPTNYVNALVNISANGTTTPVKGAPVFAQGSNGFANGITDSTGSVKLYVQPGTYTIQGFAPAFGPLTAQTGVSVTNSSNPTVTFTVNAGNLHVISGKVTQGGNPVVGMNIGANGTGSTQGGNGAQTDSTGAYSLYVPAGIYSVQGWSQDTGGLSAQTVDVTSGNASNVDWTLAAAGTLHIEIKNAANVSSLFAGAFDPTTGKGNGTDAWTASSTSKVATISLPAGTYDVHAGSPGLGGFGSALGTVITANQTTNVSFDAAGTAALDTLSGTVTASSVGVSGATVWASAVGGSGFFSTETATTGAYSLVVPDGSTYHMGVRLLGYISSQGDVDVPVSGNTTKDFTLTSAGSTITGTVKDSNGNAISGAFVQAFKTGVASSTQIGDGTDASGAYSLSVDAASTWNLVASGPCYNPSSPTAASAGDSAKNFTLTAQSGCTAPTPQVQAVTDTSGGQVSASGITLNIPANALGSSQSSVSISIKNVVNPVSSANATPLAGSIKDITATDPSGTSVTALNSAAPLVISYDPNALPVGFDASKLQLGYFDTATNQWESVAATVDTTNHTLTAQVSHFTEYGPILPGVPSAPTGLSASSVSASSISLSWTASPTATSYKVYRSTTNSGFSTAVATGVTGTSYTDTGLTSGTTYYYEVAGVDDSGEGLNSSSANAAPSSSSSSSSSNTRSYSSGGGHSVVGGGGLTTAASVGATSASAVSASAATEAFHYGRSLSLGSKGDDVSALQAFLVEKGYLAIPAGVAKGYFGDLTRTALIAFQKSAGIDPIGVFGPLTAVAVEVVSAPASVSAPTAITRSLSLGSKGDDVSALQAFLVEKGYLAMPAGVAKGYFGPLTEKAVEAFQSANGIESIGVVGPKTRAALGK
ncbi:MAG: peptidoglycan-binding protein [Patescibacteria group bacterium]|nr:peptidoglycan-binding protein [Patescibacteria group bacterium]